MNLNSYQYANQSAYPDRNTPLQPTQAGMYGGSNSVNFGQSSGSGGSGTTTTPSAASPSHAAMYGTAPSPTTANYNSGNGGGSSAAPQIGSTQAPQGAAPSYNTYGGAPAAATVGRPGGFFYPSPAMTTSQPSAPGQPLYHTNAPPTTLFQMSPSSSLAQAPAATQLFSPQQQQQQQQLNASAAAMAAYGNPATNINMGYKLFVGQVPAVCTEEQLRPLFGQFGRLLEIKIMRESNGRSRGSAWVRYESEISAQRAIEALNEKHVVPPQTNALRVQFATPNQNRAQAAPIQFQPAQFQQQSIQAAAAPRTISAFITTAPPQQQQRQQQPPPAPPAALQQPQPLPQQQASYTTATYATAPQGYAPAPNAAPTTAYLSQGPYASASMISYSSGDPAFAVRAAPQNTAPPQQLQTPPQQQHQSPPQQQQQQQQQFTGRMEYVGASQPGGDVLYTATSVPAVNTGAMQQVPRQGAPQPPQQQIQPQQVLYTAAGQVRTGVVYAPEGYTVASQMLLPQPKQQQPQQWRS